MKIGINCLSILNKQYTGIGRYTYNLLKGLSQVDGSNKYFLYARKGLFKFNKRIPNFETKNFYNRVDYFKRGVARVLKDVDVYHSPSFDYFHAELPFPLIVTVHDLIFRTYPKGHPERTIDQLQEQCEMAVRYAQKIICCSQNTIDDLKKYFSVDESKLALVYQGVDQKAFYPIDITEAAHARETLQAKGIHQPYLLSVGTIEPRKNLEGILRAFALLKERKKFNRQLVVAGMKGWLTDHLDHVLEELPIKDDVVFVGYLKNEELRQLYNFAEVFVFPSFYEGFGFPIIESFCCGTPVVTSNVSSCPEIAQDGALIVDPHDPEAIARAIAQIIEDQHLQERLVARGLEIGASFDERRTAQATHDIYIEVGLK